MESVVDALRDVQKLAVQGVLRQGGLLGGATAVIGFRRRREVLRPGLLGGATAVIGFRRRREVVPPDIGTYAEAIGQRSGVAEVGRRSGSSTASSAIREARLVRRLSGSGTACSVRGRGQSVFFDGCFVQSLCDRARGLFSSCAWALSACFIETFSVCCVKHGKDMDRWFF